MNFDCWCHHTELDFDDEWFSCDDYDDCEECPYWNDFEDWDY